MCDTCHCAAGTGVTVAVGPRQAARVAITDIHDSWAANALAGLQEGQLVRAAVLAAGKQQDKQQQQAGQKQQMQLSLRRSRGGCVHGLKAHAAAQQQQQQAAPEEVDVTVLKKGDPVKGYIRQVSAQGAFVSLDRGHLARIKISHLSDGFLEDPAAAFPPGQMVGVRLQAEGCNMGCSAVM